jgi:parallel beta-helix repeat protein
MILVGVALCSSMYANAAEWYVSTSGNDSYAGTSWILAKRTIQSAVDAASSNDTVWVSDGTYNSGTTTTPGYSSLNRVVITNNLTVRSLNGPDVTIIEGSQGSTVVRGLYMSAGTLSGFTVRNSQATTGAGIYCSNTSPMTTNCIVSNNTTTGAGGGMRNGTAIDCTFSGNTAIYGGGMYYGTATNCTFSGNTATEDGGGKYESTANNCTFSGNEADDGGGMYYGTANHCTFSENRAYSFGGGMVNGTAESCLFVDNDAIDGQGDGSGGGMYDGTAFNCTFSGNTSGYGGGMSEGVAYNCIVWGNSAQMGNNLHNTSANYTCSPDLTAGVDHNITADQSGKGIKNETRTK